MFSSATTTAGLALMGLAAVCILLAIAAVRCYSSKASSMDVFLLSILVAMFLDCGVLIGVQAALILQDIQWTRPLCTFYVWCWVTLRFAEVLSLLALSIDRAFILHLPTVRYKFKGTTGIKVLVLVIWMFSGFMGSIPILGWTGILYYRPLDGHEQLLGYVDNCFYISYEIDHNFGVFIIITQVALFFSSVLCLVDVHLQMRYYKNNTLFTIEERNTSSPMSRGHVQVTSRSRGHVTEFKGGHQVSLAHENCRLAFVLAFVSYLLNHVPYTVISLIGVLTGVNADHARLASLWFVLLEALVLPQTLWLFNRRYRAAYRRVLNGIICRQPFCCSADLKTMTLEGYLIREEVPELIQHTTRQRLAQTPAQLGRAESGAAINQRSTSEPNLSEGITDSSAPSNRCSCEAANDNSNIAQKCIIAQSSNIAQSGFPRACSLDSHLDEPGPNSAEGEPTVAERDIQMSEVIIQELDNRQKNVERKQQSGESNNNTSENSQVVKNVCGEISSFAEGSSDCVLDIVSVEFHPEVFPKETGVTEGELDKPPTRPPRRRKQGTSSARTSVSSTATPSSPGQPSPGRNAFTLPTEVGMETECTIEKVKQEVHLDTEDNESAQTIVNMGGINDLQFELENHLDIGRDPEKDLVNDLEATVDLDEVMNEDMLNGDELVPQSIMSESLLVQSTYSVEERYDSISNPNYSSPPLTRRSKHPLVVASRVPSIPSSVSSGLAFEEQDIDSVLDKLSLASTFTDKDNGRINTWEKIDTQLEERNVFDNQIENVENGNLNGNLAPNSFPQESNNNKTQQTDVKVVPNTKHVNNKNLLNKNENDKDSQKIKTKTKQKIEKAPKRKAKHSLLHRNKESKIKSPVLMHRQRPNTNSLDRDALKTGLYFNAEDVCDFELSRNNSIEESVENQQNGGELENNEDGVVLEPYKYANDDVWIPMTQSTESEPGMRKVEINSPVRVVPLEIGIGSGESDGVGHGSFTLNSPSGNELSESDIDSLWIRRNQSEGTFAVPSTVSPYPKIAGIHSNEGEMV